MALAKTYMDRRSFLKSSALAGGGLMLSFSWLASCQPGTKAAAELPSEWFSLNGYLKIAENGLVTIMSPNPEGGQNIKTAFPMIVAEELDVDWKNVIVEQAPLDIGKYTRQFIGGSQAIRQGWQSLRSAGATARQMLKQAAANSWNVSVDEVTTEAGVLYHKPSGKEAGYGEMAAAAVSVPVPENTLTFLSRWAARQECLMTQRSATVNFGTFKESEKLTFHSPPWKVQCFTPKPSAVRRSLPHTF